MSDQQTTDTPAVPEPLNPFDEGNWQPKTMQPAAPIEPPKAEEPPKVDPPKVDEPPPPAAPSFDFKTEFGWESPELGKQELAELRALKEKGPEIKFENEESKNAFELLRTGKKKEFFEYLKKEIELSELEAIEVADTKSAERLIKTNFLYKYKDLTPDEVDDMFFETYQKPEKPEQGTSELDEEYDTRVEKWKQQCAAVDKRMIRDAKLARPELAAQKTQLKFPDIDKKEAAPQGPSPEELAALQKMQQTFLSEANSHVTALPGLSVTVKEKDFELPLTYSYSQEEKTALSSAMNQLAESGFNVNKLFEQRWLNDDNTFNTPQIAKDLLMVFSGEKAAHTLASKAANERMELYLKDKKQINVGATDVTQTFTPANEKTEQEKMQEYFFSQQ